MTKRSARFTLAALTLVCTLPVAASYLAYYVWPPKDTMNYGELLRPDPLPEGVLAGLAGQADFARSALEGRWTLVYAGPGDCGGECEQALYALRQTRLAQGQDMTRLDRLWLVTDDIAPAPELLAGHEGMRVARGAPSWLERLPASGAGTQLFLVDPLGNVMMRFPAQPDIKLVIRDVQRLLKYSALGRG